MFLHRHSDVFPGHSHAKAGDTNTACINTPWATYNQNGLRNNGAGNRMTQTEYKLALQMCVLGLGRLLYSGLKSALVDLCNTCCTS